MNLEQLQRALAISDNKLTITHQSLTRAMSRFLTSYHGDQPIVLVGATATLDGDDPSIVVTGTASLLGAANLSVIGRFSLDDAGEVRMVLDYRLRGNPPKPTDWVFSNSFPELPVTINYQTLPETTGPGTDWQKKQKPLLESLVLYNSSYVLSTHASQHETFGVPLAPGVNFVSNMRPQGVLGILEHSLASGADLVLYGTVVIPTPTGRTRALEPGERVWSRDMVDGIRLQAALAMDVELGNLELDDAAFRVYSPPSRKWMDNNSSFKPVHGYTATLRIPSADIDIALDAELTLGLPEVQLKAFPQGVSLGKLTQLLDVTGGADITSNLPAPIKKGLTGLKQLELTYLGLDLGMSGTRPDVPSIAFAIGMPAFSWKPFGDTFEVTDIGLRFTIASPFGNGASRSVSVMLHGTVDIEGVPVLVVASSKGGFTLYASLQQGVTIPLQKLMKRYTPKVPAPSDLTIDDMSLILAPGKYYTFTANMASKPNAWVIPVGPGGLTVSDVAMSLTYARGAGVTGYFAGVIGFGKGITLAMNYGIPGDIVIRGSFPSIKLSQLTSALSNQTLALPGGFDIDFEHSSVLIQKTGHDYVFQMATQVKNTGSFAFEVRRVEGGKWGFAAGLDLGASKPSSVPGLKALNVFEGAFKLQKCLLVVSSFEAPNFKFPGFAQFANPNITSKQMSLPDSGIMPGLSVFAEWQIDTRDKQQKLLKKFLGLPSTLGVAISVGANPAKNSRLAVNYSTSLNGNPLVCQFGAQLKDGKAAMFLTGTMTVRIQKKPQTFDVAMMFVSGGAFVSGSMLGTVKFGDLQLSNVGLVIGISWSGIPSLGLTANLAIDRFSTSFAMFFDSTDPSRSMLAGAISPVSLKDVVGGLAPKAKLGSIGDVLRTIRIDGTGAFTMPASVAGDLDNANLVNVASAFKTHGRVTIPSSQAQLLLVVKNKGRSWTVTNMAASMRHYELTMSRGQITVVVQPQFYCAPQATSIGALRFPEGMSLSGKLAILGLELTAIIDINPNKGIAFLATVNKPMVLYKPRFFKLSDVSGRKGPEVSLASYSRPEQADKLFRQPHVYLSGRLSLMGVIGEAYVKVTTGGGEFMLSQQSTVSLKASSLSGSVAQSQKITGSLSRKGLSAGVAVSVAVKGSVSLAKLLAGKGKSPAALDKLGTIKLNLGVSGSVKIAFTGKRASATFSGRFKFQKQKFSFTVRLDVDGDDLKNIGKIAIDALENELKKVVDVAEKWVKWVEDGIIDGVEDVKQMAEAVDKVFDKSAKDTAKLLRDAGKTADEVGDALGQVFKLDEKQMRAVLKGAKFPAKEVDKFVSNAFRDVGKAVEKEANKVGKDVENTAKDVGKAIGGVFGGGKKKKKKKDKKPAKKKPATKKKPAAKKKR